MEHVFQLLHHNCLMSWHTPFYYKWLLRQIGEITRYHQCNGNHKIFLLIFHLIFLDYETDITTFKKHQFQKFNFRLKSNYDFAS